MNYFETYHTASKHKNGFFVFDASPELSRDEIDEIEKLGTYHTISNIDNSSIEHTQNNYPENISYYKLKTKPCRKIFICSNYTGRTNHTPDRFGNFFSHGIIFEASELHFSFRNFFNHFNFKKEFSLEEDINYSPKLSVGNYFHNSDVIVAKEDFNHFCDFLNTDLNRKRHFSAIIDEIFTFKILEKGKNISIIADKEQLQDWILSINFFLPKDLSDQITFATYVNTPKNYPFKLTGILPESNTSILEELYFHIFDTRVNKEYSLCFNYTELISKIIQESNYDEWKSLNEELRNVKFSLVNSHLKKYKFIQNAHLEPDLENYKELKDSFTEIDTTKYYQNLYNKQLDIYLKSSNFDLEKQLNTARNYKEALSIFFSHFTFFYEEKIKVSNDVIPLIDFFIKTLPKHDKIKALKEILLSDQIKIEDQVWLHKTFKVVDIGLENFIENNDENILLIPELVEKYDLKNPKIENENIKRFMTFKTLIKAAQENDLLSQIKKVEKELDSLKDKEKIRLFMVAFNHDTSFLKSNFKNFKEQRKLISQYLHKEEGMFWSAFFEKNEEFNAKGDYNYHSLSYLKKIFISEFFLLQLKDYDLIKNLDISDEYFFRWIRERINEFTNNKIILTNYIDYYQQKKKEKRSFFGNLNPFK
ncbi:hypothetical protein H2O64_15040 [Kordia sp. YSTF-M3]|uniref:GTPase-associated protein 1 N-terminal domain-containing protein n=1 Tax=Kordia aestuariivivens TaxID=2759037 RepID=A0ABR7QBU1_9FLAO|nr:hypothetical protein [Kordia aestuariivivens]MBC8755992.1 hypothetical protein [Kordia aestuariivivens]